MLRSRPKRDPRLPRGLTTPAWRRAPRALRPTRAGWLFFGVTFGVGFAALNTGNNLLYLVLSLMLSFLILSGVLSESALRGLEVERRLPGALYAHAANRVGVRIRNAQPRVSAFAIVVEDLFAPTRPVTPPPDPTRKSAKPASPAPLVFALRIGALETESRSYVCVPDRRGEWTFHGMRISTRFPFGLFVKSRLIALERHTLVYPAISPVPDLAQGGDHVESAPSAKSRLGEGAEVTGLREFAPGDPARRINWKPSVRRGQLLVSEVDEPRAGEVHVQLRTAPGTPAGAFEAHVARAASECVAHLEAGLRVGLRTDSARLPADSGPAQRTRLLRFLARVELDPAASPGSASDPASRLAS